ncbi:MAG: LamG-like jellyroll fold domain-containing protein [Planctomycetaceae bacterium]
MRLEQPRTGLRRRPQGVSRRLPAGPHRQARGVSLVPATTPAGSTALRFGSNLNADAPSKFKGLIDEVRIYRKALTDQQILTSYQGEACAIVEKEPPRGSPPRGAAPRPRRGCCRSTAASA